EGTQHGCGHYTITRRYDKRDCKSQYCTLSRYHQSSNCPHCPNCKFASDPDISETITQTTPAYCTNCEYWFKGPGAQRR
ncbi:hypothetical protein BDQ17DRAFT_1170358, partial [Cyathus striatus]